MWTVLELAAAFVVPHRTRVGVPADGAGRWSGRRRKDGGEEVRRPRGAGRIGCPRHRATRRGLGHAGWDDEQVELVAAFGRGDGQGGIDAGEPPDPDHPRTDREPAGPRIPWSAV